MDIQSHLSNFLLNITEHNIRIKRKVMKTGTQILGRYIPNLEGIASRKSEPAIFEKEDALNLVLPTLFQEESKEYTIQHSENTRIQISFTCDNILILGVIFKNGEIVLFLNIKSKITKIESHISPEVFKQLNFSSIAVHKDETMKCYYLIIMNVKNNLVGLKLIDFCTDVQLGIDFDEIKMSFCLEMNIHVMLHGIDHLLKDRRFLLSKILYRSFKTGINSDYFAFIEEGMKITAPLNCSITPLTLGKYAITIRNTEKYTNAIVIVSIQDGNPKIINKYTVAKGTLKLIDFTMQGEDTVQFAFNYHQSPKDLYFGTLFLSKSDCIEIISKQELFKNLSKIQFTSNQSVVIFFQESLNMSVCKIFSIPTLQELFSKQVDNFKSSFYLKDFNNIIFGNYSNSQTIEVYLLNCNSEQIEKKLSYALPSKVNPSTAHIIRLDSKHLSLLIIRNCKDDKQVKIRMIEFSPNY